MSAPDKSLSFTPDSRVRWVEPGPNDEPIRREEAVQTVIAWQRSHAEGRGHAYETAEAALEDFLVINWGWLDSEERV
jgi:hypothetical protein